MSLLSMLWILDFLIVCTGIACIVTGKFNPNSEWVSAGIGCLVAGFVLTFIIGALLSITPPPVSQELPPNANEYNTFNGKYYK